MTTEEKIKEIAQSFRTARMFSKHPCEIAEDAAQQMEAWKDSQYQNLLQKSVEWFSEIAELCFKLTSGNVSHLGATIRGKAIRAAEFIEKHKI